MTHPELGVKRDCPECGARFYDLNKEPAHCPKCQHEFVPEALLKPRKPRPDDAGSDAKAKEEKPAEETSLEAADKEKRAATPKRKAGLDGEDEDDDEEKDDDLSDIDDIDIDIDDEDDDSLLDDDEDDDDMSTIVGGGDDDDDV